MELIHGGDWAGFEMEYGTRPLDFSACVSPLGLPEGARKAICEAAADTERYPDPLCRALRQALAAHDGVPAARPRGSGPPREKAESLPPPGSPAGRGP